MDKWLENFARANFRRSGDTAHDLKTPLNVAVLNLELLRMRLAKVADCADDEKITAYTAAIEAELRRLARIFDAFFVLSTPPKDDESLVDVPLASLMNDAARLAGWTVSGDASSATIRAHESRMRQAVKLLFEGASKVFQSDGRSAAIQVDEGRFGITLTGMPAADFDVAKIFKFYYTDPSGIPDLSLAAARLIFETYGGELNATDERGKVMLRLSVPLGDP